MRILMTGAGGFIGSVAARSLSDEHELIGVGRGPAPDGFPGRATWVERDLARGLDRSGLPARIDAVIHLAQSRQYANLPEGGADVFAVNVAATFELLEYAREAGADAFLLASSGGVYRRASHPISETDPVEATDLYFGSKLASERLAESYAAFRTVILRPFFVYGPGQRRMLVGTLVERILRDEEVTVQGEHGVRVNPAYVEEVARVIEAALTRDVRGRFNVAGDQIVTLTDLVATIGELAGREPRLVWLSGTPPGDLVAANLRMKAELGVEPRTPLRAGLERTIAAIAPATGSGGEAAPPA